MEENFNWEDDLMTKSFQKQESHLAKLAKDKGKDYGKPIEGSESDMRSKAYQKNVIEEVVNICYFISEFGQRTKDGTEYITFGELFRICQNISNKCVGILQRGRKHRLLHFAGETLWQGADDKKIISLIRKNREIQVYYDYTKHLLPNNPEGNYWLDISGPRRSYYDWVTNVKELNPTTTAYCIQVNTPVNDDSHDLPVRCYPLTHEQEILTRPNYLVEPRVIFKLVRSVVRPPVIVINLPLEFFDPCIALDTDPIPSCPARETVDIKKEEARPAVKYLVTSPEMRKAKEPSPPPEKIKDPTPPPRKIKAITPPPRRIKALTPPPVVMRPVKINYDIEYKKSSIKFNSCTTMYKTPDPVYEQFKRGQTRPVSMNVMSYSKSIASPTSSMSVSSTKSSLSVSSTSQSWSSATPSRTSISRARSVISPSTMQSKSSLPTPNQRYRRMSTEFLQVPRTSNSRFNFG